MLPQGRARLCLKRPPPASMAAVSRQGRNLQTWAGFGSGSFSTKQPCICRGPFGAWPGATQFHFKLTRQKKTRTKKEVPVWARYLYGCASSLPCLPPGRREPGAFSWASATVKTRSSVYSPHIPHPRRYPEDPPRYTAYRSSVSPVSPSHAHPDAPSVP